MLGVALVAQELGVHLLELVWMFRDEALAEAIVTGVEEATSLHTALVAILASALEWQIRTPRRLG